ncbi:MAG: hypothetical protein KAW41_04820 [Candidatus Diapherotrites archaeon]|nr:hypothetical protein [Candidatus Diapherotrites archaeon]
MRIYSGSRNQKEGSEIKKKEKSPLKRSKTGIEIEIQTLDEKGYIVNKADLVIRECKKRDKEMPIVQEEAKHMVELTSFPSVKVQNIALDIIKSYKTLIEVAEGHNILIYPLSTYPGYFEEEMRRDNRYIMHEKLVGAEKNRLGSRTLGFHCHYTLPRGVFDKKKKFLKPMLGPKIKKTLIDSYNLAIAMDPVFITFLQSSPFVDGKFLAKDSRVVINRGGRALKYMKGQYTGFQQYGGLPPYKQTLTDLIYTMESRYNRVKRELKKQGVSPEDIKKCRSILDLCWGPVRINKLGTLEQRSGDTNFLSNMIAMSVLMKYAQRKVHQDFMEVIPSEIGLEKPFKVEGNSVYIPPHTHVRRHLQYHSAYEGLENKDVYNYCKRFFSFSKELMHDRYVDVVNPLHKMLKKKKTVSDMMIKEVKKAGYGLETKVPDEIMADLALKMYGKQVGELDALEDLVKNLD